MTDLFKRFYSVWLLLLLFTASCSTTRIITIEIPQPAPKDLPQRIQSLVLVNRTVNEKYSDMDADSMQALFYNENFNYDTVIYDLTAVDTTLKALGELLYESGRYDFVIPENRFLEFESNAFFSKEMPWNQVKELCATYRTDAVLSLDMYSTRISTEFEKESFYDPISDGFYSASGARMQVIYDAMFRVYDPVEEKVLLREFFKDTLTWEGIDSSTRGLFDDFTPVKQALTEAGIALALDFSEKIGTVWHQHQRPLFLKGDANMKHAGTFIDAGDWEKAMALWMDTAEKSKSKSTKSKAQLNIAIGYELQGDIDKAVSWALDSYNTMYRPVTYRYLEILKQRKRELQKQVR